MRSRWSPARKEGLRAFDKTGVARESNVTSIRDETVYWQTRVWLEKEGLIEQAPGPGRWYRITPAGEREAGRWGTNMELFG